MPTLFDDIVAKRLKLEARKKRRRNAWLRLKRRVIRVALRTVWRRVTKGFRKSPPPGGAPRKSMGFPWAKTVYLLSILIITGVIAWYTTTLMSAVNWWGVAKGAVFIVGFVVIAWFVYRAIATKKAVYWKLAALVLVVILFHGLILRNVRKIYYWGSADTEIALPVEAAVEPPLVLDFTEEYALIQGSEARGVMPYGWGIRWEEKRLDGTVLEPNDPNTRLEKVTAWQGHTKILFFTPKEGEQEPVELKIRRFKCTPTTPCKERK